MITMTRTELLKLPTTRLVPMVLGVAYAIALYIGYTMVSGAGVGDTPELGHPDHTRQLFAVPALASLPFLVLGLLSSSGEHRHGTALPTFLATPRRHRVVAAKAAAMAVTGLAWTLITTATLLAVVFPWANSIGVDFLAAVDAELVRGLAVAIVAVPLFAVLGVGLGALLRNQVLGVVVVLVWFLFLETNLITPKWPSVGRFLPNTASTLAGGFPTFAQMTWWIALLVVVAWAVGATVAGAVAEDLRDV